MASDEDREIGLIQLEADAELVRQKRVTEQKQFQIPDPARTQEANTQAMYEEQRKLEIGYEMELEVYNKYKEFYKKAEDEDCVVGQFLLQFLEIQRKAVGHYGDLLAKYETAEATKEILEFDQHINDVP